MVKMGLTLKVELPNLMSNTEDNLITSSNIAKSSLTEVNGLSDRVKGNVKFCQPGRKLNSLEIKTLPK